MVLLWLLPAAVPGAPEPQPYRIDSWQVDDGLPQSSVLSIVQTHDGYLWLGTFGGLVRFDGVQFKVFTPNSSPGLPSRRILSLFEDRRGTLWIGTEEGHLVQYANGQFRTCSPPGWAKLSGYVQCFAENADGQLWLVTPERQLIRIPEDQREISAPNLEALASGVNFMARDARGQIWTSSDTAVSAWKDGRLVDVAGVAPGEEATPAVLAGSRSGGCWVASGGRLRRLTAGGCAADYGAYPWSKGNVVRMLEDRNGQVWVGTYGSGLYCYATNGAVRHFSTGDGLPGDLIRSLFEDSEGNIWVGTEGYGLARVKPVVFRSYGRKEGLSGDCVLSVCEGDQSDLWVGLIGDGLDHIKDGTVEHFGTAQGLPNDFVWSVFYDRSRTLWAGTWGGGLCRLAGNRFVPFANPGECSGIVCALYQDSTGDLWVGQQRPEPQIVHLHDGQPRVIRLQSHITGTDVRAMVEDREGGLWVGTQGDGLYRLTRDGRQIHFGTAEGLNNDYIRSLYEDADGVLWIGTYGGGLNRFKDGKFTSFTTREGLANDSLGFIAEDRHGYLWCASLGGVFRVSKAELEQFAAGRTHWIRCLPFTKSDGLPSLECTGGCQPSGCQTRDGRLWFTTVRGVAVVDPDHIPVNKQEPPVVIDQVVIEGKERISIADAASSGSSSTGPLRIAPGWQRLEFHYAGLSLTEPMKVRYKYRLEGVDEDWVEAGTRRTVNYSHLQPGPYCFYVQACNNDGVWNERGASLPVLLLPRFWQTWWFKFSTVGIVALLFVAVYEIRVASERKLARVRLRIARDLHDEVGSNLGSIALLSEMITAASEEAEEIRRVARQTAGSLRDIVWFLDPAGDKLEEVIPRMKDTARTLLPGIPFEFIVQAEAKLPRPSLHLRRNVFPMFKEILHNIAKHARATRVLIRVVVTARRFELCVEDNGAGFDPAASRTGNGLKNLQRRAAELRGELRIEAAPGRGARLTLSAPIT